MAFKLLEGKALAKLIGAIGTARVQLDGEIQIACMQVIGQSIVHRNTSPANSLLGVVSKHHVATVVSYLEKHGNVQWDKAAKNLAFREQFKVDELDRAINLIGDAKWYDAKKPPKVVSEYDVVKVLDDQFDKLLKAKAKGVTIKGMEVLEIVMASYHRAVAELYESGDKSLEEVAIEQALEARAKGLATPKQLEMLAEHFAKNISQVTLPAKEIENATLAEARELQKQAQQ